MNIWSAIILITLTRCSSGSLRDRVKFHKAAELEDTGVAIDWTPEGTSHMELDKEQHFYIWKDEEIFKSLTLTCRSITIGATERGRPINRYVMDVASTLEVIEIESYDVTGCPYGGNLLQKTTIVKQKNGYKYETLFKDVNEKCYRRTYTTKYDNLSRTFKRDDVEPIDCTDEVVSSLGYWPKVVRPFNEDEDPQVDIWIEMEKKELKINSWSISGEFDKSRRTTKYSVYDKAINLVSYGCEQVLVHCGPIKRFDTDEDVLVADISVMSRLTEIRRIYLDIVAVQTCENDGITGSFMCEKQEGNERQRDTESEFKIIFQMHNGDCFERLYATAIEYKHTKMREPKWLTIKRYGTRKTDCPSDLIAKANKFRTKKRLRHHAHLAYEFIQKMKFIRLLNRGHKAD